MAVLVFEDEAVEEGPGSLRFMPVEGDEVPQLEPKRRVEAARALLEAEGIARDLEGLGEFAEDLRGGWEVPAS